MSDFGEKMQKRMQKRESDGEIDAEGRGSMLVKNTGGARKSIAAGKARATVVEGKRFSVAPRDSDPEERSNGHESTFASNRTERCSKRKGFNVLQCR